MSNELGTLAMINETILLDKNCTWKFTIHVCVCTLLGLQLLCDMSETFTNVIFSRSLTFSNLSPPHAFSQPA